MRKKTLTILFGVLAVISILLATSATSATAATTVVRVDESGDAGWTFNPDPANATPYHFTIDEHSIGSGSLFVEPIAADPPRKFIGGLELGIPVADLSSISYDFLIAGNGLATDANDFYLNVYATIDNSNFFYDCRYDFVPTTGSTIDWMMATFNAGEPTLVTRRSSARIVVCPPTLAGMPAGSHVRAIAINVGDTSPSDSGLAGYYDNVVVTTTSDTTIYDFEASPASKDDCKNGGWAAFGFSNQGDCIQLVNTGK